MSKETDPETQETGAAETPPKLTDETKEAGQELAQSEELATDAATQDSSENAVETSEDAASIEATPSDAEASEIDTDQTQEIAEGSEEISDSNSAEDEVTSEEISLEQETTEVTDGSTEPASEASAEPLEASETSSDQLDADHPEPVAETEPVEEPAPPPEPAHELADVDPEPHHSSFASTALMLLLGAIFISGLTLWGAPKIAPYLPASMAKYLAPASQTAQAEINELKARLEAMEDLRGRVAVLEAIDLEQLTNGISAANDQAAANQTAVSDLAVVVSSIDSASQDISDNAATTAGDLAQVSESLAGLSTDLAAMQTAIDTLEASVKDAEAQASGAAPVTAELQASVIALQTKLQAVDESLQVLPSLATKADLEPLASIQDLAAAQTAMAAQIAEVSARADAAHETGKQALNETQSTLKGTAIRGLSTQLRTLVFQGAPYATTLTEMEEVSGVPAPADLAAPSGDGLVSMATLAKGFTSAARAALAADRPPIEGDGTVARLSSWLSSQVSVRPTQPIAGDSTGAVLSRMEAAVNGDDGAQALVEAEGLSDAAAGAMADWLAQLSLKVSAEAALAPYIAAVGGES